MFFAPLESFELPLTTAEHDQMLTAASQHCACTNQKGNASSSQKGCLYSLLSSFVFDASSSFMSTINIVLFHMCHFSKCKASYGLTVFTILDLFFICNAVQGHCQFTLTSYWQLSGKKSTDLCYFLNWTYKSLSAELVCLCWFQCLD